MATEQRTRFTQIDKRRGTQLGDIDRTELKSKIDELMRQYDAREIDGDTYSKRMMELTSSEKE